MSTRKELVDAIGARYRLGSKGERSSILDEFVGSCQALSSVLPGHSRDLPAVT